MGRGKNCAAQAGVPGSTLKHAPIVPLFFIWRLKGREAHGYSLMQDIRGIGMAQCKTSTVYSILSKLEKSRLVRARYDKSGGHVRRLYRATKKGEKLFGEFKKRRVRGLWREFISSLLD